MKYIQNKTGVAENNEVLSSTGTAIDVVSEKNGGEFYYKRLTIISDLIIGGMTIYDIYRYAKNTWGIDPQVADFIVDGACEKIRQYSEKESKVMPARLLARFNELYAVALAKGDLKICTRILNSEAKLFMRDTITPETETKSAVVFEEGDDAVL